MADTKYTGINPPLATQAPFTPKDNSHKKQDDEDLETPSVMPLTLGKGLDSGEAKRLGLDAGSPLVYKQGKDGKWLKRKEGEEYAREMALTGKVTYSEEDMKPVPQNLLDATQKANRDLNMPKDTAWISERKDKAHSSDQAFDIPGHKGEWALFVDKKHIGTGQGQVSAEGWANVAKKLGQSSPLAAPAGPQ